MDFYTFLWMGIFLFTIILELSTPGLFLFFPFSCAALVAWISSEMGASISNQMLLFTSTASITFLLAQFVLKKINKTNEYQKTNSDLLIGKKAMVTTPIIPPNKGYINVDGELWPARSISDPITYGVVVEILSIHGAHVLVKPVASKTS